MHQGKVGHNYEDDAVDVVSSNDDPLAELDVESCMISFSVLFHKIKWKDVR